MAFEDRNKDRKLSVPHGIDYVYVTKTGHAVTQGAATNLRPHLKEQLQKIQKAYSVSLSKPLSRCKGSLRTTENKHRNLHKTSIHPKLPHQQRRLRTPLTKTSTNDRVYPVDENFTIKGKQVPLVKPTRAQAHTVLPSMLKTDKYSQSSDGMEEKKRNNPRKIKSSTSQWVEKVISQQNNQLPWKRTETPEGNINFSKIGKPPTLLDTPSNHSATKSSTSISCSWLINDEKYSPTEEKDCEEKVEKLAELQANVRKIIESDERLPKLDEVEEKYGWKAQMHGDPYNLKPLHQVLPYYAQVPAQKLDAGWMEKYKRRNYHSSLFHSTVEPFKYSYIVHRELPSEHFYHHPQPVSRYIVYK